MEQNNEFEQQQAVPPSDTAERASLFVVIATYNERENVESLIQKILALEPRFHVLIVDDNSPDGTGRVVKEIAAQNNRVHLLERPAKRGYGSASAEGLREALRLGARAVFTMDADHSHDPLDLPRLAQGLEQYDVVVGSRYVGDGRILNWSLFRVYLSRSANRYARTILRLPYKDCTSGFRGYRREVLEKVRWETIRSNGYAFLVELLYAIVQNGHSVCELPITYTERRVGQSKMSRGVIGEAILRPWTLLLRPPPTEETLQAIPTEPAAVMPRPTTRTLLAILLVLATFLRFYVLTQDPFWVSEIIMARTTRHASWGQVFASIRNEYVAETPGQIVLATALYRLFGRSVWLYRATSASLGVLGVLAVFLLGRRLRNARLGLLAAFLLAIMPYHIRYSQEFRTYTALVCFSAFAGWAFVRAASGKRLRDWVIFGLVAGLGLLFHFFVGLVILAAGIYCFLADIQGLRDNQKKSWPLLPRFCLGGAIALSVISPWMIFLYGKPMSFGLQPTFQWGSVGATLSQLAGSNVQDGASVSVVFVLFYTLVIVGVFAAFALVGRLSVFLLLWIAMVPLVFWSVFRTGYFFSPRQFIYLQPVLGVLAAMPTEWICTICERHLKKPLSLILQRVAVVAFGLMLAIPWGLQIARYYVLGSVNKFIPLDDIGDFLRKNAERNDFVVFDWEPYILEYHCGRTDVRPWSQLPQLLEKDKAIWVVHTALTSQNDPLVTAHPPSAKIQCGGSAISYYSTATSFSLPDFLTGLVPSKGGAEVASIGVLWVAVSPKIARVFFETAKTSTMNRRTRADFYQHYGNFLREKYFKSDDKETLEEAVLYLGKAFRDNPYNPYYATYYADVLFYANQLEQSCRVAQRGIKMASGDETYYPAHIGFRSAEKLSDSRRVFEFGALVWKHQKDPAARQRHIQQFREYVQRHPEAKDLARKTLKRHELDPNEIAELR